MYETADELRELQRLLDTSFERGSAHLTSIMRPEQGVRRAAQRGAPRHRRAQRRHGDPLVRTRISALDGHFLHGRWHATTAGDSPKARQMRARPAISAAYPPRDGVGVFCHGRAVLLQPGTPEFEQLEAHCVATYGQSPAEWGPDIAYIRIEPSWLVAVDTETGQ